MEEKTFLLSQSNANDIDYLIISGEEYVHLLQPLITWKMQRGLRVSIETIEDIEDTYEGVDSAEQIRNCIIEYHFNRNTLWVLLAGGPGIVPSRTLRVDDAIVSCDSYYSNLDDNWVLGDLYATLNDPDDWTPEVFVGRLPADTRRQMISLVSRLIQYEQNPPVGSWMEHAVYAGTFANFDYDVNGNDIFDEEDSPAFDANRNHNWMKEHLLPDGWTSTLLAENEGIRTTEYPYDLQINETSLVSSINEGASIVMADAHGSPTGMIRSIFTNDVDGDTLFDFGTDEQDGIPFLTTSTMFDVNGKLGFYFLAACSTGTFTEGTCLTESITRTSGIGCIGSSNSAYYDPSLINYGGEEHLGWVTQGLSERVWEQILVQGHNRPGMALALAKDDYSSDKIQYDGEEDQGRTMAQFNLMGDPEVPLWIGIPSAIETPNITLDEQNREISIQLEGDLSSMTGISITIQGTDYYQMISFPSSGVGMLNMPDLDESTNYTITLSQDGCVPLQITIELPAGAKFTGLYLIASIVIPGVVVLVMLMWYKFKKR
ncbi:MAG: C25 family cysteine peptidase [Candidatus Thorarchaeota archaeon]